MTDPEPQADSARETTKRNRWIDLSIGAVVLVAIAVVAYLQFGRPGQLDTAGVEVDIQTGLVEQFKDSSITVDCPDDIRAKVGSDFHCIASDGSGNKVRVTVTVESDDEYTWTTG